MERLPGCDMGEVAAPASSETKVSSDRVLNLTEPALILGSKAATTPSTDYIELLILPTSPQRQISRSNRILDLATASLILLFVLPLMLVCALAIRLTSQGPVIYRQARIGRDGQEFVCFKFRTMAHSAATSIDALLVEGSRYREEWATLYKLRQDPRVTFFGRFMRRYSLDELPQLFNVLKGDMSIVGPRPIVADEVHRYGDRFANYCSVKPGITGLWQVSGRHALSYEERVRLDAEYADNKSTRLDLLILWRTIPVVLWGQNE